MKKCKYIGFIITLSIGLVSCSYQGGDEDPTNIEMEVLRASLLEKELQMDELRTNIDEQIKRNDELSYQIEDLQTEALRQNRVIQTLKDNANQQLEVKDTQDHYYSYINNELYIIMSYHDYENEYSYDNLMHYKDGEEGNLVYQGDTIQFGIDNERGVIYILDGATLRFFTMEYTLISELDVSDQLVSPYHRIQLLPAVSGTEPYIYLTFSGSEEDETSTNIYGVAEIQYKDPENLRLETVSISTSDYVISPKNRSVYYSYYGISDPVTLTRYRFKTNEHINISKNTSAAFSPHIEDDQLFYYSESAGKEKMVEIDDKF